MNVVFLITHIPSDSLMDRPTSGISLRFSLGLSAPAAGLVLVWLYDDLSPRRLNAFTRLGDSVTVHPALYPKCVGAQPLWGSSSPSITLLSYFLPYSPQFLLFYIPYISTI